MAGLEPSAKGDGAATPAVFKAITTFLDGTWPEVAAKVEEIDPSN